MMRVRARVRCEFLVALQAHSVRVVRKLQGCGVGGSVRCMGLMAVSAVRLALAEARRPAKCFHDKGRLTKPAIQIEGAPRYLREWAFQISWRKFRAFRRIVHFAVGPRLAKGRLRMALSADRNILTGVDPAEIHDAPGFAHLACARTHRPHMSLARPMAHFAIDPSFAKFEALSHQSRGLGNV